MKIYVALLERGHKSPLNFFELIRTPFPWKLNLTEKAPLKYFSFMTPNNENVPKRNT